VSCRSKLNIFILIKHNSDKIYFGSLFFNKYIEPLWDEDLKSSKGEGFKFPLFGGDLKYENFKFFFQKLKPNTLKKNTLKISSFISFLHTKHPHNVKDPLFAISWKR